MDEPAGHILNPPPGASSLAATQRPSWSGYLFQQYQEKQNAGPQIISLGPHTLKNVCEPG